MPPTDPTIRKWWPTTQSLDLVEGSVREVGEAVRAEVVRYLNGEPIVAAWFQFPDLNAAFSSVPEFANVPTHILALPTRSKWSVLWYNTFLCDGYDSLCWNLTSNHHLTTVHWSAHDEWTTSQSGALLTHRRHDGTKMIERTVQAAQQDKAWHFYAIGQPLEQEDVAAYEARRKRDRLNERSLLSLLNKLGAEPWSEDFYALPEEETFVIRRPSTAPSVIRRSREEVLL
jgi:hypothetical protein